MVCSFVFICAVCWSGEEAEDKSWFHTLRDTLQETRLTLSLGSNYDIFHLRTSQ